MLKRVFLLSIIPLALLSVWIWQDLAPSGFVRFEKNSVEETPQISQFYPEGRLGDAVQVGDIQYQRVLGEPIYFDVRLPRVLDTIEVKILATGEIDGVVLGLRQPPTTAEPWRYILTKPNLNVEKDVKVINQQFELSQSYIEKGKVRFLLAIPEGANIELGRVEVEIKGEPLSLSVFWEAIKRRIKI